MQICASDSPIHARDDRLHGALLPDAQAARNEKKVTWLIAGWLAALVVLPLLMRYGVMPLWRDNLHSYSHFSPDFFINILCSYVRLVLVNVLLVRTLAIWRTKREAKKANRNAAET